MHNSLTQAEKQIAPQCQKVFFVCAQQKTRPSGWGEKKPRLDIVLQKKANNNQNMKIAKVNKYLLVFVLSFSRSFPPLIKPISYLK